MPWLLVPPGHQQPWYWLCEIGRSLSYMGKDFNYLCPGSVEEYIFMFPMNNSTCKGLMYDFCSIFHWLKYGAFSVNLHPVDYHRTSFMTTQHWFRWWLGSIRHQIITWTNVHQALCCHMASLGVNELMAITSKVSNYYETLYVHLDWVSGSHAMCYDTC